MADTIPSSPAPTNPLFVSGPAGQTWWCRGPSAVSFTVNNQAYLASIKSGLVSGSYASLDDMFAISVPADQQYDWATQSSLIWLSIGGGRVNEYLGQRFNVPLQVWSSTVVWANCELAYIGASRKRGLNTEAMISDFQRREETVISWLKASRDHEITPDERLSVADLPQQALRYDGPVGRGWDRGRSATADLYGSPYNGNGAIGRYRGRWGQ